MDNDLEKLKQEQFRTERRGRPKGSGVKRYIKLAHLIAFELGISEDFYCVTRRQHYSLNKQPNKLAVDFLRWAMYTQLGYGKADIRHATVMTHKEKSEDPVSDSIMTIYDLLDSKENTSHKHVVKKMQHILNQNIENL